MKKMHRVLSVFLAVLTLVSLLAIMPGKVAAAGINAPVVTASNDAATGAPKLTWDAVEGAEKYQVYRATSKSGTYSRRVTTTKTTFTNTNAETGTTYYYKVRALAADGTYAESKIVSRTCDLPRPVITLSNVASSGAPKVTWEAVAGAQEYQVYRAASKDGTYSLMKTTTSTAYTNTSAVTGETYYYKVKAIAENSSANSAYSTIKSRTRDLPRPVVTVSNVESSGAPKVTWEAVDGAKEYQVYRATAKDGTYSLMKTTAYTAYTNTSAKAGETYYYKVKAIAVNSAADSAYSSVKSCTRVLARPKVSVALTASGYPKVTWGAVDGAEKYEVYRATSKGGTYKLMKTVTSTAYTNTSAESGQTYYYKVRAICSNPEGNSAYSEILSIRAGSAATSDLRYVALPSVYIYKSASSSSSSVKIPYMTELKLGKTVSSSSSGQWCEVYYEGKLYYIWLTPGSDKLTTVRSTMEYTSDNPYQQEVIDLAVTICKEWKTDYRSNESGVVHSDGTVGFDCSGYVGYVINTVMQRYVPAYRLSPGLEYLYEAYDIYNTGLRGEFKAIDVELEDIQPGDVIFFYDHETLSRLSHCGLYMGNNEFLHSTSTWDRVCLMPLNDSFADRFICVKRFIPEEVEPANATWYAKQGCPLYADTRGTEKTDLRLTRGEAVTVLYTRATDSNGIAYIRTSSGKYGFVWTTNLSKTK